MSPYLPPRPDPPPIPATSKAKPRRPGRPAPGEKKPGRVPWGWLEWLIVSQTFIPALLFVPGMSAIRTPARVAAYAITLVAWAAIARGGRARPGAASFPPRRSLLFVVAWLGLSVFHPNAQSLLSATAQAMLYLAVLSPAFWAASALADSRQIGRLMAILFLCNALSAVVGIGQVFRPGIFNPPVIPAMQNIFNGEDLMYEGAGGRKIMRPCGLTDTPGAVAPAGATAALIGLCWALRPIAAWKRLASVGLAFAGVAAIYYTQVRSAIVMLAICIGALNLLFLLQRNFRSAGALGAASAVIFLGAFGWVATTGGSAVTERFLSLFRSDPGQLYHSNRGVFVQSALQEEVWKYPLGYGMGWWGMTHAYFGNTSSPSLIWVEVMVPAWVYDGGFPLLLGYSAAVALAMFDSARIALTNEDRTLAFWAAVVFASNLSILATCFSFVTFVSPLGVQFWLMSAALHAAEARARASAGVRAAVRKAPA